MLRRPAPGERAYGSEEITRRADRRLEFLEEVRREHAPRERLQRDRVVGIAHDPQRSEEHTSELQSRLHLVCRLLLEKKKKKKKEDLHERQRKEIRIRQSTATVN